MYEADGWDTVFIYFDQKGDLIVKSQERGEKMKSKILALLTAVVMAVTSMSSGLALFSVTAAADEPAAAGSLKAGAGAAAITFDADMFPIEGFSGAVESDPYLRILLLEDQSKAAIVSAEMVNVSAEVISDIKQYISQNAGVPEGNVWVHANHTITTMHAPKDADTNELYVAAMMDAAENALAEALASFRPALMGVGQGESLVNANRNKLYPDGQYHIGNFGEEDEERGIISNHTMTVVRFDDVFGNPIGMIMSHGTKPTAIDNAEMSENTRLLSSDVPGLACTMMEEEFDCPCMFLMGASGDQIPKETTNYFEANEEGNYVSKFGTVAEGIGYVTKYGKQMGDDAIGIAEAITCDQNSARVLSASTTYSVRNNKDDGDVSLDVVGLALGDDLAFIGLKPEIDSLTEEQLWEASPYKTTLCWSFTNGDQKYMPHDAGYDEPKTVEGQKSGFKRGAAEIFVEKATGVLDELKGLAQTSIKAGAGASPVTFDSAMFPIEGFSGNVHSDPYLRIMLIEDGAKA